MDTEQGSVATVTPPPHTTGAIHNDHSDPATSDHRHKHNLEERFKARTAAGVRAKHKRAVTVLGRIGWCAKGIVYGLIGGLCCRGAISEGLQDTSPQGAFVLLGKGAGGVYVLIIMAVALCTYIIWRFWEGVTGQGQHECYSKFKNFFNFRLSPFVSGGVYCAYLAYILILIPKAFNYKDRKVEKTQGSDFTASWRGSNIGRLGLFVIGLAFLIAFIVMALSAFTKKFHRELRLKELRPWAKWLVLTAGHLGACGRGALFLGVAILMFRAMGDSTPDHTKENTVSKALNQLVVSRGGRAVLFIIGFFLVVYCLFAVLNAYPAKIFPTPLPSQAEQEHIKKKREDKRLGRLNRQPRIGDRLDILRDNFVEVLDLPGHRKPSTATRASSTSVLPVTEASRTGHPQSAAVGSRAESHSAAPPLRFGGNSNIV